MAFSKKLLDEILKDYRGPDDFYGPQGIRKQLTKALVERTMKADFFASFPLTILSSANLVFSLNMCYMIAAAFLAITINVRPLPLPFFIASYRSISRQLTVFPFNLRQPITTRTKAVLSPSGPRFVIFPWSTVSFKFCPHSASPA
ncbi:MAG: hypothetical protein LBF78_02110 [Treponema sp.]|jgi:hypothetical protein|nr:hypothetical protein [Treponema sp.]